VIKREREKNQTGIGITPAVEAGVLSGSWLWSLRSHASLDEFGVNLGRVFGPRTVARLLLRPSLLIFLGVFSSMKQMLTDIVLFRRPVPPRSGLLTSAAMPLQLMPALEGMYLGGWRLILISSMLAALFVPTLRKVRAQYAWTCLIVWSLLGTVLAAAAISAGPRDLPDHQLLAITVGAPQSKPRPDRSAGGVPGRSHCAVCRSLSLGRALALGLGSRLATVGAEVTRPAGH
jgi:hypothetical protein